MKATGELLATVQALLEAAHPMGPDEDPIVLPGKNGQPPVLLVRSRTGAEPRAIAFDRRGSPTALRPQDDKRLPGHAWLPAARLAELLGEPVERIAGIRVRAWRPGRRLVLAVPLHGGQHRFVKMFTHSGYRRAVARLDALPTPRPPLHLSLPNRRHAAAAALCFTAAPGDSLHALLLRSESADPELLFDALAAAGEMPAPAGLPVAGLAEARDAAVRMTKSAAALVAELEPLPDLLQGMPCPQPAERCWQHGDLHDKQVFLAGQDVHCIDLDSCRAGSPWSDPVNLVEHLRLRSLQSEQATAAAALGDEILGLWRARYPTGGEELLAWRAVVRARLAGVYGLRPRWHDLARRLAHEALELLETDA